MYSFNLTTFCWNFCFRCFSTNVNSENSVKNSRNLQNRSELVFGTKINKSNLVMVNSQKMDEIFASQGLEGVTTLILSKLSTKALVTCRLVSKSWKSAVDRQKFLYVRKLEKITSKNHDFSSWRQF